MAFYPSNNFQKPQSDSHAHNTSYFSIILSEIHLTFSFLSFLPKKWESEERLFFWTLLSLGYDAVIYKEKYFLRNQITLRLKVIKPLKLGPIKIYVSDIRIQGK